MNIEAVRLLLENGSDIDIKRFGDSTFTYLFEIKKTNWQNTEFEYRQILELFLYSNPSHDEGKAVVAQGLEIDAKLIGPDHHTLPRSTRPLSFMKDPCRQAEPWRYVCHDVLQGTYLMDATEHSFLGQDLSDISLNFTAPLLIESGFPIQRGIIDEALQTSLHPAVKAYLQQCLDGPRPLKRLCRDSLRKHFKGREIHKYVGKLNIPESVRDFILLKTILPTISHDEWNTVKLYQCLC